MKEQSIVILGGGVGGLVAANTLRRKLGRKHRIALVEKNRQHAFQASFPWVMTGYRTGGQISKDIHQLVHSGVDVIIEEVRGIDHAKKVVTTAKQSFEYDYLVISLGVDLVPESVPGLAQTAHTFYTMEGADILHNALQGFKGGDVALVVSSLPYKCPGAPHEAAMLISDFFRRRSRHAVIHLFTPEPQPMPVAGPQLGEALKQMLESRGIKFNPLHKLVSVNAAKTELNFEDKPPVHYDMLIAIPPHRAPAVVRNAGLTNEAGWIPVDKATLMTKHENVFAIGDVALLSIPGRWKHDVPMVLPKAGVFAHLQAETVADHIVSAIEEKKHTVRYSGFGYCIIETGEGSAGFAYGNFFAEPHPQVLLRESAKKWHFGRVLFEKWWMSSNGLRKGLYHLLLKLGTKMLGIPVNI